MIIHYKNIFFNFYKQERGIILKLFKKCLAVFICSTMLFAILAGCQQDNSGDVGVQIKEYNEIVLSQEQLDGMANEKDTIRFLAPGVNPKNENHQFVRAAKRFEEATGKKIEFIQASWDEDDWRGKLMASIGAGDPIDMIHCTNSDYPLMYTQQFTQPIEKYVPINEDVMNLYAMNEFFNFEGKHYVAVPKNSCSPYMMYYNKDMINQFGFEDPYELYKKGEWTVKKMEEMAAGATQDISGNGENDTWGMTTYYPSAFIGMNKTSAIKIENGQFALNLDDPALANGLEISRNAYYNLEYCGGSGGSPPEAFMKGTHLFLFDVDWAIGTFLAREVEKPLSFDWGYVPHPYGPDNTEGYNIVTANGFNIVNGSQNPWTAGAYIQYALDEDAYTYFLPAYEIPKEFTELCQELIKKPFYSLYYDSIVDGARDLLSNVNGGLSIAKSIEKYRQQYAAAVAEANTSFKIPDPIKLPPVTLDFEKGLDGILPLDADVELDIEEDEPLSGKQSLWIGLEPDGLEHDAFITDPEVAPVSGYNKYKITFEYFVEELFEDGQYYFMFLDETQATIGTKTAFIPKEVGKKATATVNIPPAAIDSDKLHILFGGVNVDVITIDNLLIEQDDE